MKIKHTNKKLANNETNCVGFKSKKTNYEAEMDRGYLEYANSNPLTEPNRIYKIKSSDNQQTIFSKNNSMNKKYKNSSDYKNVKFTIKQKYDNGKDPNLKNLAFSDNLVIADLDEFFKNIYDYYYNKGFNNILTQTILDNISYLFSIHFIILNVFIINWKEIIFKCKNDNYCDNEISNSLTLEKISSNLIENKFTFVLSYGILIIYYLIFLIKSVLSLKNMKFIKKVYDYKLKIKQNELENIKFDKILNRLISLQKIERFCRREDNISKFYIISRIMRQENFLIALFSNNIIETKISFSCDLKIPFLCRNKLFKLNLMYDLFSNYFYNKINESVVSFAFSTIDKTLNKKFISLTILRFKLFFFLIFECIFLIPLVFLKIIFWLFKNADNLKSDKKTIFSNKVWDRKFLLLFKNYNELQHFFEYRISCSYKHLEDFNNCFKYKEKIFKIVKKFLKLIFGSILFLIFIISFFESRLLTDITIFGKNFVWIGIGIGVILSITSESNVKEYKKNPYLIFNYNFPNDSKNREKFEGENFFDCDNRIFFYKKLLNCLINIPKEFTDINEYFSKTNKKINLYYELGIISMIKEIIGMVLFPIIWIKLIINAEKVRQFILQNSTDVPGIGTVCTFSFFNLNQYKNTRDKKPDFMEFGFNDKKFFNSCFYYRNIYYRNQSNLNLNYDSESDSEINYLLDINRSRESNDHDLVLNEEKTGLNLIKIKEVENKIFNYYFEKNLEQKLNNSHLMINYSNQKDDIFKMEKSEIDSHLETSINSKYQEDFNTDINNKRDDNYLNYIEDDQDDDLNCPTSIKDFENNFFYFVNKIDILKDIILFNENNEKKLTEFSENLHIINVITFGDKKEEVVSDNNPSKFNSFDSEGDKKGSK